MANIERMGEVMTTMKPTGRHNVIVGSAGAFSEHSPTHQILALPNPAQPPPPALSESSTPVRNTPVIPVGLSHGLGKSRPATHLASMTTEYGVYGLP